MQVPEVDETIKRIQSHKGVQGVIVTTKDGMPIRTTMDNTSTVLYVGGMMALEGNIFNFKAIYETEILQHIHYSISLERSSSMVRDIDPTNELQFLRIRSKKYEIMLTSEEDYIVIVIQNPNEV